MNPLTSFPLFGKLQELVSQYLLTGNNADIDTGISELLVTHPKRLIQGALLLASFHEIFLLSVLPADSTRGLLQRRLEYDDWLMRSPVLKTVFTDNEHRVLLLFASGTLTAIPSTSATTSSSSSSSVREEEESTGIKANATSFFTLTPESSADSILRLRVAAHVVAVALSANDDHPFALFRTVMLNPGITKDTFYPTMEEDVLKVIMLDDMPPAGLWSLNMKNMMFMLHISMFCGLLK